MAATHYSHRRALALDWARQLLGEEKLTPEVTALVVAFARTEASKSEYAADYLARTLAPYRRRPWVL